MASVQSIRELVDSFVAERVSPSDFANSFTPLLSDAVKSADAEARPLAIAVHAYISHYFHGLISEQELRSHVASVLGVDSVYPFTVLLPVPSEHFDAFSIDATGELVPA